MMLLNCSMLRTPSAASMRLRCSISRTAHLQRVGRLLGIGDDRGQQVRDVLVDAQLDPLGVDQDEPHLVRRGA